MDILITAGATRNPIDAMRYISANSSGQTGVWIAEQLHPLAAVHLMGSPEALLRCRIDCERTVYSSTSDLLSKMQAWVTSHPDGVVVHASAVGDYMAAEPTTTEKIESGVAELTLRLVPTPKIVDQIHSWSPSATLISFKAAPPQTGPDALLTIAEAQRSRTNSRCVFANVIGDLNRQLLVLGPDGPTWYDSRPLAMAALVTSILALS